jgi:hypothetical protein
MLRGYGTGSQPRPSSSARSLPARWRSYDAKVRGRRRSRQCYAHMHLTRPRGWAGKPLSHRSNPSKTSKQQQLGSMIRSRGPPMPGSGCRLIQMLCPNLPGPHNLASVLYMPTSSRSDLCPKRPCAARLGRSSNHIFFDKFPPSCRAREGRLGQGYFSLHTRPAAPRRPRPSSGGLPPCAPARLSPSWRTARGHAG